MDKSKKEPLYRYLTQISGNDPVTSLMEDIEALAREGYVEGTGDGTLNVLTGSKISAFITEQLASQMPARVFHHMAVQAIDKKMFITISRVGPSVSKTALALVINEDDSVTVGYLEHDALFNGGLAGKKLYCALSTVVIDEAGAATNGFIRFESSFTSRGEDEFAMKVDFKLSRTTPFFIYIAPCGAVNPVAITGATAKHSFEEMESAWRA